MANALARGTGAQPQAKGAWGWMLGFAFCALWMALALRSGAAGALPCALGVAVGCAALFVIQLAAGTRALHVGMGRRAFAVECGVGLALPAVGTLVGGVAGVVLWALGGLGLALCAAAWFDCLCRRPLERALTETLLSVACALVACGFVLLLPAEGQAVRAVALAVCAVGAAACLGPARSAADDDPPEHAREPRSALVRALRQIAADAELAAGAGDDPPAAPVAAPAAVAAAPAAPAAAPASAAALPAPSRAFMAAALVPLLVLAVYFGLSLFFVGDIAAHPLAAQLVALLGGAAVLLVALTWLLGQMHDDERLPLLGLLALAALLALLVALFVDREGKTLLMGLQMLMRMAAVVLVWLGSLSFVRRGTFGVFQAFGFAFGLFSACLAAGLACSLLSVTMDFLAAFPREGIYLFSACAALAIGYELVVAAGFFREGGRAPERERVVRLETSFLDERCAALAADHALSDREREIVQLLCHGRTRAFIAQSLYLSENTVKWYCRQIYQKLGIHSKQELLTLVGEDAS